MGVCHHSQTVNAPTKVARSPPMPSNQLSQAQLEAEQRLFLNKKKPPAKIDGLLHFMDDMQHGIFNSDEHRAMAESESGRRIARAITQCDGLGRQSNQLVQDGKADEALQSTMKYLDCLSYMTCSTQWKHYTACWVSSSLQDFQELREQGSLKYVCHRERRHLESCVGDLVSATVRVADEADESRSF